MDENQLLLHADQIITTMNITVEEPVHSPEPSRLISDFQFRMFQICVYVILIGCLGLFGISSNIINIVVFIKMGVMSDSSNVSLLGLAVSDLGGVSSLVWFALLTLLKLVNPPDLNWDMDSVVYITAGWPHIIFVQLTCWITAYIAFERCMCVVFPFKIKNWFSPHRSRIVIICIMLYFLLSYLPLFLTRTLQWRVDSVTNKSRLVAVTSPQYKLFRNVIPYINIFISSTASLLIVFICTRITASKVKSSSKWRTTVTSSARAAQAPPERDGTVAKTHESTEQNNPSNSSVQKERKLVKMITTISIVFMICTFPGVVNPYIRQGFPDIDHGARYHNLFHVLYGCCFFLECLNSSINIFIYYRMSSRYRQVFRTLFGLST